MLQVSRCCCSGAARTSSSRTRACPASHCWSPQCRAHRRAAARRRCARHRGGGGGLGRSWSPPPSDDGLGGLECLSGIPGSTGATPVQNVGRLRRGDRRPARRRRPLRPRDRRGPPARAGRRARARLPRERAQAPRRRGGAAGAVPRSARTARAPRSATPSWPGCSGVEPGATRAPRRRARAAVLDLRRGKGMVLDAADHDTWSAGSFFTNPIVAPRAATCPDVAAACPAGPPTDEPGEALRRRALIEQAGFGRGLPGARRPGGVSAGKHALALTNRGGGTAARRCSALAREVRDGVAARSG